MKPRWRERSKGTKDTPRLGVGVGEERAMEGKGYSVDTSNRSGQSVAAEEGSGRRSVGLWEGLRTKTRPQDLAKTPLTTVAK